jgi:hypothetical protein
MPYNNHWSQYLDPKSGPYQSQRYLCTQAPLHKWKLAVEGSENWQWRVKIHAFIILTLVEDELTRGPLLSQELKTKFSLVLIKYHVWCSGGIAPLFLDMKLDGSQWSVSRPCSFTPGKGPPVTTGQEAGWAPEPVWTRKPLPGNEPPSASPQSVSVLTELTWHLIS